VGKLPSRARTAIAAPFRGKGISIDLVPSGEGAAAVFPIQIDVDFVLDDDAQEEIKAWSRHRHRR
jgi:hypothetical protein